jgi:hypothetical protein
VTQVGIYQGARAPEDEMLTSDIVGLIDRVPDQERCAVAKVVVNVMVSTLTTCSSQLTRFQITAM